MPKRVSAPPQPLEPLAVSFKDFYTTLYHCSRAGAQQLVASGELVTFLDRGRRMVLMEEVRAFVARKSKNTGAISPEVSAMKSRAGRLGVEAQRALRRAEAAADSLDDRAAA
jgi:hypothetical protein